jgi:replicative DNA helicase
MSELHNLDAEQAVEIAKRRPTWRVFPCDPATKAPLVGAWKETASRDPDKIRRMFERRPDAMIGCALDPGVLVIDIDHKPDQGHDATKSLTKLFARFPELITAPRTRTPSGGLHLWLVYDPSEDDLPQHQLAPGVDTRVGGKGYVIVPPSKRADGGQYTSVGNSSEPPTASQALIDAVRTGWKPPSPRRPIASAAPMNGESSVYADAALRYELGAVAGAQPGTRNTALNRAAYSLAGLVATGELPESYVRARLEAAALACGLDEKEALATIESGFRAGMGAPRDVSAREGRAPSSTREEAQSKPEPQAVSHLRAFREWIDEAIEAHEIAAEHGFHPEAALSGLPTLDDKTGGILPGQVMVIAARPSMGKSLVGLRYAIGVAETRRPVVFFSLEMSGAEHGARAIAAAGGFSYSRFLRGDSEGLPLVRVQDIANRLGDLPIWGDDRGVLTPAQYAAQLREAIARHGKPGLVVIDHGGLMEGAGKSDYERMNSVLAALKAQAQELRLATLVLAQLNRDAEKRSDKRPQMADLRDSGKWEENAHIVAMLYRDAYYAEREPEVKGDRDAEDERRLRAGSRKLEISILKNRNGPTGRVELRCDVVTGEVGELGT